MMRISNTGEDGVGAASGTGVHCIGITGGVGSGKSSVLSYLEQRTNCRIFIADYEAKKFYEPGNEVFDNIIKSVGWDVIDADGILDKRLMSDRIFSDPVILSEVNGIVHPAMEALIRRTMAQERASGEHDFLFVEAALLIECGYEEILDEIWYVYASEDVRRQRLKESRGYTDNKVSRIIESQLSDSEYRKHCSRIIDNDGTRDMMRASVDNILKGYEIR